MLSSELLKHDARLQACAVDHRAHVQQGEEGAHVGRIQLALVLTDDARIARVELLGSRYGSSTAQAVLSFKTRRDIVNRSYQTRPDNIVGIMTVARLDAELLALEARTRDSRVPAALANLPDSAPAFLLSRACTAALGGDGKRARHLAIRDGADTAEEFRKLLRSLGNPGSGSSVMLGPRPGHLRSRICAAATKAASLANQRWANPGVKACWQVTRNEGSDKASATPDPLSDKQHWCGIFATSIWANAAIGVNWIFANAPGGISNGPYLANSKDRVKTSTQLEFVAPGDIFAENFGFLHHVLVLRVSADGNRASVIEGNAGAGDTNQTIFRVRDDYQLDSKQGRGYFYSVDSLREPPVKYGTNIPGTRKQPK